MAVSYSHCLQSLRVTPRTRLFVSNVDCWRDNRIMKSYSPVSASSKKPHQDLSLEAKVLDFKLHFHLYVSFLFILNIVLNWSICCNAWGALTVLDKMPLTMKWDEMSCYGKMALWELKYYLLMRGLWRKFLWKLRACSFVSFLFMGLKGDGWKFRRMIYFHFMRSVCMGRVLWIPLDGLIHTRNLICAMD